MFYNEYGFRPNKPLTHFAPFTSAFAYEFEKYMLMWRYIKNSTERSDKMRHIKVDAENKYKRVSGL